MHLKQTRKNLMLSAIGVIMLLVGGCTVSENKEVEINEKSFPDSMFRGYVSDEFDRNLDGKLNEEEITAVTEIYCNGTKDVNGGVKSLKGVEYFKNLEILECYYNMITELDISRNTKLKEMDCFGNLLKDLNVSKNTELKELDCGQNQLKKLDVSKNVNLNELHCGENQLTKLDIRGIPGLCNAVLLGDKAEEDGIIDYWDSSDSSCDYWLTIDSSVELLWDDAYAKPDRKTDELKDSQNAWDDSGNLLLNELNFPDRNFREYVQKEFDTDENDVLSYDEIGLIVSVNCSSLSISSLKGIEYFTKLERVDCSNNQIESLDVQNLGALKALQCYNNQLISLDLTGNSELGFLSCDNNQLKILDLSANKNLDVLTCSDNRLEELNVKQNIELTKLECENNVLSELDVSESEKLEYLNCSHNKIKEENLRLSNNLSKTLANGTACDGGNGSVLYMYNGDSTTFCLTIDPFEP